MGLSLRVEVRGSAIRAPLGSLELHNLPPPRLQGLSGTIERETQPGCGGCASQSTLLEMSRGAQCCAGFLEGVGWDRE
jgi:hypothetical protein